MPYFLVLFFLLLFSTFSSASPVSTSILTYYIPIKQQTGSAQNTAIMGGYGYFGYQNHSLELEYDNTKNTDTNLDAKHDCIGIYTYYGIHSRQFKIGYHGIDASGANASIFILGGKHTQYNYYGYKLWELGSDAFASQYPGQSAYQASPYFTTYFTPSYTMGTFEITTKLNLIKMSGDINTFYNQTELNLTYYWTPNFTVTGKLLSGESKAGVFDGGFLSYGTQNLMKDGYGVKATYYFNTTLNLSCGYFYQNQEDSDGTDTYLQKYTAMLGLNF